MKATTPLNVYPMFSARRCLLVVVSLLLGLAGCGVRQETELPEPYPFANAPTKHRLNLARLLDDELTLASGADTLRLRIRFERATRTSVVANAATGEQLLRGWVTRYRGAFYFTQPRPDSTYWVHAWRRDRRTVQGLLDAYAQMMRLTEAVDQHRYAELTRLHAADSTIRLRYDAQLLRPFYEAELASMPVYQRLRPTARPRPTAPADTAAPAAEPDTARPVTSLIRELYPNPAHRQATVQLADSVRGTLRLLRADGTTVLTQPAAPTIRLQLATLPAGTYMLHVQDARTGRVAARRLVVQH